MTADAISPVVSANLLGWRRQRLSMTRAVLTFWFVCGMAVMLVHADDSEGIRTNYLQLVEGGAYLRGLTGRPLQKDYDAYRYLVRQGEKGWRLLFSAQFNLAGFGDLTRHIAQCWESVDIPEDTLKRFQEAERAEHARLAMNESWAIAYAAACARVAPLSHGNAFFITLSEYVKAIRTHLNEPTAVFIEIAYLRVFFVEDATFPGHQFPWTADKAKQKKGLLEI